MLRKPRIDIGYFRSSYVEFHNCRNGISYHGLDRHRLWDYPNTIDAAENENQRRLAALDEEQDIWELDEGAAYTDGDFATELFQEYKEKYDLIGVGNLNASREKAARVRENSFTFLGYEPYIIGRCYPVSEVFGKYADYFSLAEKYLNEFGLFATVEEADNFAEKFAQIPVGTIEKFDCMTTCYLTLHENFAVYRYNGLA